MAMARDYMKIASSVQDALATSKPIVALESTIIAHGMPYPENFELALKLDSILKSKVRKQYSYEADLLDRFLSRQYVQS